MVAGNVKYYIMVASNIIIEWDIVVYGEVLWVQAICAGIAALSSPDA